MNTSVEVSILCTSQEENISFGFRFGNKHFNLYTAFLSYFVLYCAVELVFIRQHHHCGQYTRVENQKLYYECVQRESWAYENTQPQVL